MKAIILAGGEGTRLRPISSAIPKPMVPLMGKPVLEHIIHLLKNNGITQICLALRFLPQLIAEYFGDGEEFGVELEHRIEHEALGTAGAVRACLDFIGDEDFIVLPGDAVCDFDLTKCVEYHRRKKAEATVVLTKYTTPLEYGLAVVNSDGKINCFVEKPGWDNVVSDLISSGIYILSPSVFSGIKSGENLDFAKVLFPKLLQENRALYGYVADGYWCDIGNPESYLKCTLDALSGQFKLDMPEYKDGICCLSPISPDVTLNAPCYIGQGVNIGAGSIIGPETALSAGCTIGKDVRISRSAINGAFIGDKSEIDGAVVCTETMIGKNVVLCSGSVIGAGCKIGNGACIAENVKIWPKKQLKDGYKLENDLISGSTYSHFIFKSKGIISGEYGFEITPLECFRLGAAAAQLSPVIGCGYSGEAGRVCLEAFCSAACAQGARTVTLDCSFPSEAAFSASLFAFPLTVYFSMHSSNAEIWLFGPDGLGISREQQRKIELSLSGTGELFPPVSKIGSRSISAGITEAYIASAAAFSVFSQKRKRSVCVSLSGCGAAVRAVKSSLIRAGINITSPEIGTIELIPSVDGFTLSVKDELGEFIDFEHILLILSLLEFENGCGSIAVPYCAPAAIDVLASRYGASVLRLGRDGDDAARLWSSLPFLQHAPFAAARLCSGMAARGETLHSLSSKVPNFSRKSREVCLIRPRATIMRMVTQYCSEVAAEFDAGITISGSRGCIRLAPSSSANSIILNAEAANSQKAGNLCLEFEKLIRSAEKKL